MNQLIEEYLKGESDSEAVEKLRTWLEADPANVKTFVHSVFLHRQLRLMLRAESAVRDLIPTYDADADPSKLQRADVPLQSYPRLWTLPSIAMALLLAGVVGWQLGANHVATAPDIAAGGNANFSKESALSDDHFATLVNVTNCSWDQKRSTADLRLGGMLRSGESLHLLEGVADINATLPNAGVATIHLEGPLAMTLNNQGMLNLLYGHITGQFACNYDHFTLDTPLGRVVVSGEASIGIMATANKVELHVFSGSATLEPWEIGLVGGNQDLTAAGGHSIVARVDEHGNIALETGKSKEGWFMTPAALAASQLRISEEYVSTILSAKPVAYWRFESDANGVMRNEVSDRFHCQIVGDAVRWHGGKQNSSAEFGMTTGPGYLMSTDNLNGAIHDDYSIEVWVKPTYYHHGALLSLIAWNPSKSPHGTHQVHLELCGPVSGFGTLRRQTDSNPGRVRFMEGPADAFSSAPYAVRKWQHIVATKRSSEMTLFIDGNLAATTTDTKMLPDGLQVLMGQLYPSSPYLNDEVTSRLFVGELDEVALYDRALPESEIQRHFQLARPRSEPTRRADDEEL